MATYLRLLALAVLVSPSLVAVPAVAAEPRNESENPTYYAYSVGVRGELIEGEGQKVTRVRRGSLADQLGLEAGDVIVAVNNIPVDYLGAWDEAINEAFCDGGWMTMVIVDGETGEEFSRHVPIRDGAFL